MRPPRLPRGCALLAAAVCMLALARPAGPQGASASESALNLAQGAIAAGGIANDPLGAEAQSSSGQAATGPEMVSPGFTLRDGIAWTEPLFTSAAPLVVGTRPASGDKDGGETVRVFGYNFQGVGAGPLNTFFGGVPGSATTVVSNVQALTTTPARIDSFGNPLAEVDLEVANFQGSDRAEPGFFALPSLLQTNPAQIARPFGIRIVTEPGSNYFLAHGISIPGLGAPFPPFDGSAVLAIGILILTNFFPLPDGQHVFVVRVPNDPALIGALIEFQALAVQNLFGGIGSFTNRLAVLINA